MNMKKEDNLNKLLNTFMAPDSAAKAAEDFRQADLIFERYESVKPDAELLANIKADISREIGHSKASIIKAAALRLAAVAAVFLVMISVWFAVNQDKTQQNLGPAIAQTIDIISAASIWDSEDMMTNDNQYETFEREIEQIESEIAAMKYGNDSIIYGESELMEIESGLIEILSDFWKG